MFHRKYVDMFYPTYILKVYIKKIQGGGGVKFKNKSFETNRNWAFPFLNTVFVQSRYNFGYCISLFMCKLYKQGWEKRICFQTFFLYNYDYDFRSFKYLWEVRSRMIWNKQ